MDRIDLDLYSIINKVVRNIIRVKRKNLVGDIVDLDWKKLDELVVVVVVDAHHSVEDLDLIELIDSVDLYVVVVVLVLVVAVVVVANNIVVEQSVVVLIHLAVVSESVADVTVADIVLKKTS